MGNLVEYRAENGIAVLELNNPPVNSYTYELLHELDEAILKARLDDSVNHIYEPENFFEEVLAYARQFAAPNKASFAVGRVKRAMAVGMESSLEEGLAFEREVLFQAFESQDATAGLSAYNEKRAAKFKGV